MYICTYGPSYIEELYKIAPEMSILLRISFSQDAMNGSELRTKFILK